MFQDDPKAFDWTTFLVDRPLNVYDKALFEGIGRNAFVEFHSSDIYSLKKVTATGPRNLAPLNLFLFRFSGPRGVPVPACVCCHQRLNIGEDPPIFPGRPALQNLSSGMVIN